MLGFCLKKVTFLVVRYSIRNVKKMGIIPLVLGVKILNAADNRAGSSFSFFIAACIQVRLTPHDFGRPVNRIV